MSAAILPIAIASEDRPRPTDRGNAHRLVAGAATRLRFCRALGWITWDGKRWSRDPDAPMREAKAVVDSMFVEAAGARGAERDELARHALKCESVNRLQAMVTLGQSEPELTVSFESLDADPWALTCQSGIVDLRTGELRPHDPLGYSTRCAPVDYDPHHEAPQWLRFLADIFDEDPELIDYVQRLLGYATTGLTRERIFIVAHGDGANGKSTLVNVAQRILGDYAATTPLTTLVAQRSEGIPNDLAALRGVRFVAAGESERQHRIAAAKIKTLTGGDEIAARYMRGEWFTFRPNFLLWLSTNYRPEIDGSDRALADRVRLIPFRRRFEAHEQDRELADRLVREEGPGILAWLVAGAKEWARSGLGTAQAVSEASEDYRATFDRLGRFLEEACKVHSDLSVGATDLYEAFKAWCGVQGERDVESQTAFGRELTNRGFRKDNDTRGRILRRGLTLKSPNSSEGFSL